MNVWRGKIGAITAWLAGWAALLAGARLPAQTIPGEWLRTPPGEVHAKALTQGAERYGWPAMARALRAATLDAYARGGWEEAAAWQNVARWAGADALGGAGAAKKNATVAPRGWLLADAEFSAAYFALERPADDRAAALAILDRLRGADPAAFDHYKSLALAIALVYDRPPPAREWPHAQVSPEALPRRLPEPTEVFSYFVELDRSGKSLHRLARLDAAELRFLVDVAAPAEELEWARAELKTPLSQLDKTYSMVRYRDDRIDRGAYDWPGKSYELRRILEEGGICVDQAYFATQAGKARGVPTLLFSGAGRDGRHAWFGYLGSGGRWRLDAGRYAEQRYVTGLVTDPQTWEEISDHELAFLSEGFWRERNAREAAAHAMIGRWLFEDGRREQAERAARAAVRLERRELRGWDLLLDLRPAPGEPREAVAREAARSLQSYPELQAHYTGVAITSLGERGQAEEADRLGRELARRFKDERGDLSVAQLVRQMEAAAASDSVEDQLKLYRSILRRFGRGGGAAMWDQVVRPFLSRLTRAGRFAEAREVLELARENLVGSGGTQLDAEMRSAGAALRALEEAAAAKGR